MSDTKEKILLSALRLFAERGYEAVSVSDIAGELSITKGALYKHYKNKQSIFDSIVLRMEELDFERAVLFDVPEGTKDEMNEKYENTPLSNLLSFSRAQFDYWTKDEFASAFRKMLTLEQFRNEEMKNLYGRYLVSGPLGYVEDIFSSVGEKEPKNLAAELYGAMFFFICLYDVSDTKETVRSDFETYLCSFEKKLGL
ncbi:MAG: TetR/AcrR family transcriptional regulator [Clostridia bacterium]|nr:TetR/AcrR family transcriptional regulator [Clostridia bacterium]